MDKFVSRTVKRPRLEEPKNHPVNIAVINNVPEGIEVSEQEQNSSSASSSAINVDNAAVVDAREVQMTEGKYNVSKGRKFQSSWLQLYSWLECITDDGESKAYCKVCRQCESLNLFKFSTKRDSSFTSEGFCKWKNALVKFKSHDTCSSHREAVMKLNTFLKGTNVCGSLVSAHERERTTAKCAMSKVITSLLFLARQNIAMHGHEDADSNFQQLLRLHSDDSVELK